MQNQFAFCFNEAEVTVADADELAEPTIEQVIPEHKRHVKKKGKRSEELSAFPVRIETHVIPEEKLQELFDGDYRKLPDEIYKKRLLANSRQPDSTNRPIKPKVRKGRVSVVQFLLQICYGVN